MNNKSFTPLEMQNETNKLRLPKGNLSLTGFTPVEMQNETNKLRLPKGNLSLTGFTLLELVVVIVIIGILATLGYNQYALVVEKSRIAEAIQRIGTMRQLAYEYYLKNGSLGGMTEADVGVNRLEPCSDKGWYVYSMNNYGACANLDATRCTQGGGNLRMRLGRTTFIIVTVPVGCNSLNLINGTAITLTMVPRASVCHHKTRSEEECVWRVS
jgi:prepilin-type N-terminal cleavage/methylation domain-containing protein